MNNLFDKSILLMLSLSIFCFDSSNKFIILPILIVIIISCFLSYTDNIKLKYLILIMYCFLILYNNLFFIFVPLIAYDLFSFKQSLLLIPISILFIFVMNSFSSNELIITAILTILSYILESKTTSLGIIKENYYSEVTTSKELTYKYEQGKREFIEKQDYEINLATLTERNRIARDIHDNVGHLLSRCILQIGALLATTKDSLLLENLKLIKDTLAEAMNSIRNNVHNLHEESINLKIEVEKLLDSFTFCSTKLTYSVESSPSKEIKYAFITIIKEALSNIIKHSNASECAISIIEHPGFYQLIIKDNGTSNNNSNINGIGLSNINDRVISLNGNINISNRQGFRIFISIPK